MENGYNLLHDDIIDFENQYINDRFNLFNVLNITRREINHSDVLAWLINPRSGHSIYNKMLEFFLIYNNESNQYDYIDWSSFEIYREKKHIDVLAISHKHNIILAIENKIDALESDHQLQDYTTYLETKYPTYEKHYLFLSPNSRRASMEEWKPIGYEDVLSAIKENVEQCEGDYRFFINQYIDLLEKYIVPNNEEMKSTAIDLYRKHKGIFDKITETKRWKNGNEVININNQELNDIINNHRDAILFICNQTRASNYRDEYIELINQRYRVIPEMSFNAYIRFKSDYMDSVLPDDDSSSVNWDGKTTNNIYFYEIYMVGSTLQMYLCIAKEKSGPRYKDRIINLAAKIQKNKDYESKNNRPTWPHFFIRSFDIAGASKDDILAFVQESLDQIPAYEYFIEAIRCTL